MEVHRVGQPSLRRENDLSILRLLQHLGNGNVVATIMEFFALHALISELNTKVINMTLFEWGIE